MDLNILDFTKELIAKYDLRPNSYVAENPWLRKRENNDWLGEKDEYFIESSKFESMVKFAWEERVVPYYSGINLWGYPSKWSKVLLEFLSALAIDSPDFKIYNLKGKFGGLRFYADNISDDAQKAIQELENVLCDKKLIY